MMFSQIGKEPSRLLERVEFLRGETSRRPIYDYFANLLPALLSPTYLAAGFLGFGAHELMSSLGSLEVFNIIVSSAST